VAIEGSLAAEERQAALLAALRDHGQVEIEAAAEQFGVHPMTIRRSLKALEKAGRARLVRGGAVHVGTEEFEIRQSRALSAKKRIAEKIAPQLSEHESVGLDASSTVHVLAGEVPQVDHLLVVTYGIPTFQQIQGVAGVQAILSGGELDPRTGSLVGLVAQESIERFALSCCVLSTSALDAETGTMEPTMDEAAMKQSLVRSSRRVILAIDSTKLSQRSSIRSVPLSEIDLLVTELDPGSVELDPFRDVVELL
jgi:DeoR family fructose operon transcriptional repressor